MGAATGDLAKGLLLVAAAATAAPPQGRVPSKDLGEWLQGLSVQLPGATERGRGPLIGEFDLSLGDVRCAGFGVGAVRPDVEPLAGGAEWLGIHAENITVRRCELTWRLSRNNHTELLQGSLSFGLGPASIDFFLLLNASSDSAVQLDAESCRTRVPLTRLAFRGSLGHLFNASKCLIEERVRSLASTAGCSALAGLVQWTSGLLGPLLKPPAPPGPRKVSPRWPNLVQWGADMKVLHSLPSGGHMAALLNAAVDHATGGSGSVNATLPAAAAGAMDLPGIHVSFVLREVAAEGLDSWSDVTPVAASVTEAHSLRASASSDALNLSLAVDALLTCTSDSGNLGGEQPPLLLRLDAGLWLHRPRAEIQAMVAADRGRVDRLTIDGLARGGDPESIAGTVAAAIRAINVTELEFRADSVGLSKLSLSGGRLGEMLSDTVRALAQGFLASARFQRVFPNMYDKHVAPAVMDYMNTGLPTLLANLSGAAQPGGGAHENHPTKGIDPVAMQLEAAAIAGAVAVCLALYAVLARRALSKAGVAASTNGGLLEAGGIARQEALAAHRGALANHYRGRYCVLILLPLWITVNIGVNVWCLLAPLNNVRVKVVGGVVDPSKVMADESLLVYSFQELIHDLVHSRAYLSAALIILGGAVVPPLKGLLTLYAWLAPLQVRTRSLLLAALDVAGRLCFVTLFYMTLVVVTVHAKASATGLAVNVAAEPTLGNVVTAFGLLSMTLSSHWAVFLHSRTVQGNRRQQFSPALASLARERLRAGAVALALVVAGVSFSCMLSGDVLVLSIGGLAGLFEKAGFSTTPPTRHVSVFGLPGQAFADISEKLSAVLMGVSLYGMLVVGPCACLACWLVQWATFFVSGTSPRESRHKLARWAADASPYFYSWCGMEVFWLAIVAAHLEMDLSVQFIVESKAGKVCSAIKTHSAEQCIHVSGALQPAGWWLLAAAAAFAGMFLATAASFGLYSAARDVSCEAA